MAIETVIVDGTNGFTASDLGFNSTDASFRLRRAIGLSQSTMNMTQSDTESYLFVPTITDTMEVLTALLGTMSVSEEVYDTLNLKDSQIVPIFETLSSSFNAADLASYDPGFFVYLADSLVMQGFADSRIIGYTLIQEYINLLDALVSVFGFTIFETFNLSNSDLVTNIIGYSKILDSLVATASVSYTGGAVVILKDSTNLTENITLAQVLTELIQDVIYFGGVIEFDGDAYTFVLNTENEAISTYTNFNFNSIYGNLAATDTGIYELVGINDAGADIQSSIKTGLMDFGSNLHKQIPYAYIGASTEGNLVFKTIVTTYGNKKERWYKLVLPKDATDTARIKLGKGVKSRYWQFELMNASGADFDVESIDLLPLTLKRRI